MAQGFFKKNEKLLMTLLLLIIAPSFAFTGIMTVVMQSNAGQGRYVVFGETLSNKEFQSLYVDLVNYQRIQQNRFYPGGQRRGAREEDVLQRYILKVEADRLGIVLSQNELEDEIRAAAKDFIAWHEALQSSVVAQPLQLFQDAQNRKATVRFTLDSYRSALEDERLGLDMNVRDFEDTLARGLRVDKLQTVVVESAIVSEREIYSEFEEEDQLRALELVRVPTSAFLEEARSQVIGDDKFLDQTYWSDPDVYTIPDRLQIEALRINLGNLNMAYQPTDDEITARYDEDKRNLYLRDVEFDPFGAVGSEEDEYEPLEEVRAQVIASLRTGYTETMQGTLLEDALVEARRRKDAGEDAAFDLLDLVPAEHRLAVEVILSEPFGRTDVPDLPANLLNQPRLQSLFREFLTIEEGDFCEEPVPLTTGDYIYRVVKKSPEETRSFQEARDEVVIKAAEEKSKELATDYLQGWADEIRKEASDATLASLAQEANYTVYPFELAGRRDQKKVTIDGEQLASAFDILQNGFAIGEVGEVGEPLLARAGDEAYLVRLTATERPDSSGFEARRENLQQKALRRKQEAVWDDYIAELYQRAQPQPLFEVVDDQGSGS